MWYLIIHSIFEFRMSSLFQITKNHPTYLVTPWKASSGRGTGIVLDFDLVSCPSCALCGLKVWEKDEMLSLAFLCTGLTADSVEDNHICKITFNFQVTEFFLWNWFIWSESSCIGGVFQATDSGSSVHRFSIPHSFNNCFFYSGCISRWYLDGWSSWAFNGFY